MAKAKAPAKEKKKKGEAAAKPDQNTVAAISVALHPRASRSVRKAKALGGLAGFMIAGFASISASIPADQAGLRALACGMIGYLLAWGFSVAIWKQIVIAEIKAHTEEQRRRLEELTPPTIGSTTRR